MKNLIPISIIIAACIIGGSLVYINNPSEDFLSPEQAALKAIEFVNENMLQEGVVASLNGEITEENGVYKMPLIIGEGEYEFYVAKNGKYLFTSGISLVSASQEIPQRDVPELKVFVFSYCPYSLQYMKALFPVVDLLKGKADIELVAMGEMHGEYEAMESKRQICVRKEYPNAYWDYLELFSYNEGIKDCSNKYYSEFNRDESQMNVCIQPYLNSMFASLSINESRITDCINNDDVYIAEVGLTESLKIRSSPTVMINEVIFNQEFCASNAVLCFRSPEAIKNAICQGFEDSPEECSQTLIDTIPSPGFGQGTGDSSQGGCQ